MIVCAVAGVHGAGRRGQRAGAIGGENRDARRRAEVCERARGGRLLLRLPGLRPARRGRGRTGAAATGVAVGDREGRAAGEGQRRDGDRLAGRRRRCRRSRSCSPPLEPVVEGALQPAGTASVTAPLEMPPVAAVYVKVSVFPVEANGTDVVGGRERAGAVGGVDGDARVRRRGWSACRRTSTSPAPATSARRSTRWRSRPGRRRRCEP